jgi:hypothetical protein
MNISLKSGLCGIAFLLLGFFSAPAEPLPTTVTFAFTNSAAPIYDLTGTYQFAHTVTEHDGGTVDLSLVLPLSQDASGRLHGLTTNQILVGGEPQNAVCSVSGRVSGGGKLTRASVVALWTGQPAAAGAHSPFSILVQYNLSVSSGVLNGTAHGSAKLGSLGDGSIKSTIAGVSLPPGADGSWSLQMNIVPLAGLGGAGEIVLPGGRSLQTSLAGSVSMPSGLERIKLVGLNQDRGASLHLSFLPGTGALQKLSGTVLGQTLSLNPAASKDPGSNIFAQIVTSASASSQTAVIPQTCVECHSPITQTLPNTLHDQAGVGCESCHGPSAAHAANYYDPTTRPTVDLVGTNICAECHNTFQQPIVAEWTNSAHATVVQDFNPTNLISSCGRCHSGSVRVALLNNAALPTNAADVPIGCPVCHDPHSLTGNTAQLRNPVFSTNDFSLDPSDNFATKYDPSINLCAQCHNDRGASWTNTSESPHLSLQYNMLLGTVGELASGLPPNQPASHALEITNQCVGCHMQTAPAQGSNQPAVTGHSFTVQSFNLCLECHSDPEVLVPLIADVVTNQIQDLKAALDTWATNQAPAALQAKYGTRAWEYTIPGELSPGGPGPNATEQTNIPVNIQKARFNLYLVLHDGSSGVHNAPYSVLLLNTAQDWVEEELFAP